MYLLRRESAGLMENLGKTIEKRNGRSVYYKSPAKSSSSSSSSSRSSPRPVINYLVVFFFSLSLSPFIYILLLFVSCSSCLLFTFFYLYFASHFGLIKRKVGTKTKHDERSKRRVDWLYSSKRIFF